jgi:hypothetical protein
VDRLQRPRGRNQYDFVRRSPLRPADRAAQEGHAPAGNSIGVPSRPSSNGQTQFVETHFTDPLLGQRCASIEARGNPLDGSGDYFAPQNGGTTPTDADCSRYATITFVDYQKDTAATVQGDTNLQAQLGLSSTQIGDLLSFVTSRPTGTPAPSRSRRSARP